MPIFDDKIALVDVFVDTSLRLLEITYWHWNYVLSPFGILQQCRYLWIIKIFLIFLSSKKVCHLWKKKLCIVFFHYPVLRPLFIAIVSVYLQILALLSSFAFLSVFYLFNFFFSQLLLHRYCQPQTISGNCKNKNKIHMPCKPRNIFKTKTK